MPPVKESSLPAARNAKRAFIDAMEKWDAEAADVAVASLVRSAGADEVAELFWKYAPRDFRSIGHKIIFASNTWRLMTTIGWQNAEPIYRSLTYALMSSGNVNPAKADDPADQPGRKNRELAKKVRAEWLDGKPDAAAATDLLATFRQASAVQASTEVVNLLNRGVAAQSVWDAILGGAGELLMRRPGIVSLHSITTANAMHYAFEAAADDETRRFLLLQAAAFLTLFRGELSNRKEKLADIKFDALEAEMPKSKGTNAVDEIFADLSKDKTTAARKVLGYLKDNPDPHPITDTARRLIFRKGTDAHDYKFSSAALEDYGARVAGVARSLSRSERLLAQRLGREGHKPGAENESCTWIIRRGRRPKPSVAADRRSAPSDSDGSASLRFGLRRPRHHTQQHEPYSLAMTLRSAVGAISLACPRPMRCTRRTFSISCNEMTPVVS